MYQSPVHEAVLCQSRNCLFSWMSSQRNAWRGIALESPWAALPKPQGGMTLMIPEVYSRVIVTNVTAPNDLGPRFNPMLINFHYPAMRLSAAIIFFIDWAASCRKGSKFKRQSSSCPNSLPKRQTDSPTHQQTHTDINTNASAQCLYYIVGFQVVKESKTQNPPAWRKERVWQPPATTPDHRPLHRVRLLLCQAVRKGHF